MITIAGRGFGLGRLVFVLGLIVWAVSLIATLTIDKGVLLVYLVILGIATLLAW